MTNLSHKVDAYFIGLQSHATDMMLLGVSDVVVLHRYISPQQISGFNSCLFVVIN